MFLTPHYFNNEVSVDSVTFLNGSQTWVLWIFINIQLYVYMYCGVFQLTVMLVSVGLEIQIALSRIHYILYEIWIQKYTDGMQHLYILKGIVHSIAEKFYSLVYMYVLLDETSKSTCSLAYITKKSTPVKGLPVPNAYR